MLITNGKGGLRPPLVTFITEQTMKTLKLSLILLSTSVSILLAQPNDVWYRIFDGEGNMDWFNDIYACDDGGFAMCGRSNTRANSHFWVIRTNSIGEIQWESRLRLAPVENSLRSIVSTDDGGFIAVGVASNGGAFGQVAAIRYNAEGDTIWFRMYGGDNDDEAYAVIELKSDEFLIAGKTNSMGNGHFDGYLLKINGNGDLIWQRTYGTDEYEVFNSLREIDGGAIVVGDLFREEDDNHDLWLVEVDEDGEMVESSSFGNVELDEYLTGMTSIPGGGYGICGYAINDDREYRYLLLRVNNQGQQQFIRYYDLVNGVHEGEKCNGIAAYPNNGGFGLVGDVSQGDNDKYAALLRTDGAGEVIWQRYTDYSDEPEDGIHLNRYSSAVFQQDRLVLTGNVFMEDTFNDGLIAMAVPERSAPEIISFYPGRFELDVLIEDTITFSVKVVDYQDDDINHYWIMNGEELAPDTVVNDTSAVTIIFNELRIDTISCHVADEEPGDSIRWIVHVEVMYIDFYFPQTITLSTRRNSTIDFNVTTRSNIGDPVEYLWLLNDEQIADDDSIAIRFERGREHSVTAVASQGELSDRVTWQVMVNDLIVDYMPEQFDLSVPMDTTFEFEVFPFDPNDDSLRFIWTVNGDSVWNRSWLLMNFDEEGMYNITAYVSDTTESDSLTWEVNVQPNSIYADAPRHPDTATLQAPVPNPFNSVTRIRYSLPMEARLDLGLYDISGRRVVTLYSGVRAAGVWNATLDGSSLSSGVYFVGMSVGEQRLLQKVVLVK